MLTTIAFTTSTVNSPMIEENRNDSAYELIDMSEVSVGGSTGAGVYGAVGIAAGVAVTGNHIYASQSFNNYLMTCQLT